MAHLLNRIARGCGNSTSGCRLSDVHHALASRATNWTYGPPGFARLVGEQGDLQLRAWSVEVVEAAIAADVLDSYSRLVKDTPNEERAMAGRRVLL
jgi:hypothetical protein